MTPAYLRSIEPDFPQGRQKARFSDFTRISIPYPLEVEPLPPVEVSSVEMQRNAWEIKHPRTHRNAEIALDMLLTDFLAVLAYLEGGK